MRARFGITALGLIGALALAGCDGVSTSPRPDARPADLDDGATSQASRDLAAYYTRVQSGLLTQGLLRTDGGGPDVPFTARMLAENFERIALYEEYTDVGGRLVPRARETRLRRWEAPVTMSVDFTTNVPKDQRSADARNVRSYAARLSRVSGHPIRMVDSGANYQVLFITEDDRPSLGPRLRQAMPGISDAAIDAVLGMNRNTYCVVFAIDPQSNGTYTRAMALIRAEHPDLMRLSCIHEELAQGLGLANDSPTARPSIFNDDEEFALLTTHDEYLLRILYDDRLRAGMSADEARPIVREIANELIGGES